MGIFGRHKSMFYTRPLNKVQKKNYKFFKSQFPSWLETHKNKFVIIHDQTAIGFFNSHAEAYDFACCDKEFELGTFLIQPIDDSPVYLSTIS